MSWYQARKAVRERVAANKRRYSEAPLRDALEAQAIRALREHQQQSSGIAFCESKGWKWRKTDASTIQIEVCPFCKRDGWNLHMRVDGTKDGLFLCFVCGKSGNLSYLREAEAANQQKSS